MATIYNSNIVTNGLILCLDSANPRSYSGSGNIWSDLSSKGNNGTLINSVQYNSNNRGSLSFDGIDSYIDFGNNITFNTVLNGNSDWSISYWVNPLTNGRILDRGDIGQDPTGSLELNVRSISRNNTSGGSSSLTPNIIGSGWNYVTLTRTSSLFFNWYLNGLFSNSSQASESYDGAGTWKMGRRAANTSSIYQGDIAQILIYNRVLTAQEIKQNYNSNKNRFNI